MTENEKMVYELLLMPILCDKSLSKIIIQDGVIKSPQLYYGAPDEDMSDFTIGFYKIIYKDMLLENDGEILNQNGYPISSEFVGDTMHSFNSIANIILGDASKKFRSPIDKWPPELVRYCRGYHSLANFWVIPMSHGRKSAKLNKYDSVDYYLGEVKNCFINNTGGYFGHFETWEDFLEMHCIKDYAIKDNPLEIYVHKDRAGCMKEIERIQRMWEMRAKALVETHADELHVYFSKLTK